MKFQEMALRRSIIKRSVCTKKMQIQSAEFALVRRRYHQEEEEEKTALLRIARYCTEVFVKRCRNRLGHHEKNGK